MLLLSRCPTLATASFFFKYNFFFNFKMVFTIFSRTNPIPINATHYLFIYFHYHPIINLYN